MPFWDLVSLLATIFGCSALIPEVVKALKSRHLRDLSWGMLFLLLVCSGLWALYGFLSHETPLIISGSFNVSMEIILMVLKKIYDQKDSTAKTKMKTVRNFSTVTAKN